MEKAKEKECCPEFHPEKWSEKTFKWHEKRFIKTWLPTFFHIPYAPMIAKRIANLMELAEEAQALEENKEDILLLFTDPHPFKSEIYLSVNHHVQNANNTSLSGNFISKVFDGPYKAIPKFIMQLKDFLHLQEEKAKRFFVHYAYCPKCAEEFDHNYMVIFAEIDNANQV